MPDAAAIPVNGVDVPAAARALVAGLIREPWGQASPSVYETARLVTLAPWLTGHAERVAYLVGAQRPDGGWGGPDGYALVPTLSATEALLGRVLDGPGTAPAELIGPADRGLAALLRWSNGHRLPSIPDTPAVEIIAPALIGMINRRLDRLRAGALAGPERWRSVRLQRPAGMDAAALDAIHARLALGEGLPAKLLHALEVVGTAARGARGIAPVAPGTVGASPAATAAWLGEGAPGEPARRYLETVARRDGGPVPCGVPIAVFERAWALSWLAQAGVPMDVPPALVRGLADSLGDAGTPAGPGLPPDADTTSVALYALARLGAPRAPHSLWAYQTDGHFCTWQGEDGRSVTVNAHVLEAFGQYLAGRRQPAPRYEAAVGRVSAWLRDRQRPDGSWLDRWHASPYYATVCCALALGRFGTGPAAADAVRDATRWALSNQHDDGSWGWRGGTVEETAYGVLTLLGTGSAPDETAAAAAARGYSALLTAITSGYSDPPQWHDKDLYFPTAVVDAAVISALHLAQRGRAVAVPSPRR